MSVGTRDFGPGGAFVLGGSGGLGSAICEAFARAGVPVALSYRGNSDAAANVADRVRAEGLDAAVYQLDGGDRAAVAAVLDDASQRLDGLHSIIYAGGPSFTPEFFSRTTEDNWQCWLQNDVMVALNLAHAAIPHLRRTRGALVALSTYQANMIEVRGGVSAISKAAVDRMVAVIAKEEGRFGVRANSVRCGWIGVASNERLFEKLPHLGEEKKKTIPLGRIGKPEEVGDTVVFLCSRRAGFITGVNLTVDGGESL